MEQICQQVVETPVPKIIAIAKNYSHDKADFETSAPLDPIIFTKPMTALIPPSVKQINLFHNRVINHEVELGFVMKKKATRVSNINLSDYIDSFFLGLDLTDRHLVASCRKNGFPWDLAKGFDNSLPVSELIPFDKVKDVHNLELEFLLNGKVVNHDFTYNMIYRVAFLIEFVSQYMTLNPGDMFITGTPAGVGIINNNDKIDAFLKQDGQVLASISKVVNQVVPSL